jgi:UDP-glucose 4-epimerase
VRILVTGGAGFIGSHVAEAYLEAGHDVLVLDDLSSGKKENVPEGAKFVLGDAGSDVGEEAVRSFRPEILNHHAGQPDIGRSSLDPAADAQSEIAGTVRLLEAARRNGVRKVVYASTGGPCYGGDARVPTAETEPTRPANPHGAAKLSVELYLRWYRSRHGLDFTALRYGNVYGPRQECRGESGVVAVFCMRLLQGRPAIINGDGAQTRDFVSVRDAAKATLLALDLGEGLSIHVGTGVETDVNWLFRKIRELTGSGQPEIHGDAVEGDLRRCALENRLAFEELGWYPEKSLEEGLAETAAFFREANQRTGHW